MQGLILLIFPVTIYRGDLPSDGDNVSITGKIYRIEEGESALLLYVRTLPEKNGKKKKVICHVKSETEYEIGNLVTVTGKCRHFAPATNDGQFDSALYYRILNLDYRITDAKCLVKDDGINFYQNALYKIRRAFSGVYKKSLPSEKAGVLCSMVLGQKKDVDDEIKSLYKMSGISHILAISGLHISLIGMAIYESLKKLKLKVFASGGISVFFLISFGIMTGNSASAIRSIVMFSLFIIADVIGRTYDMLTACGISGVALLITEPLYIMHSGFLLSFGAVMGIALIMPVISGFFPKPDMTEKMIYDKSKKQILKEKTRDMIFSSLKMSISVTLATLPIQLWFFYGFATYGFLLNLIVIPLAGILLVLAIFGGCLSLLIPSLGQVFLFPSSVLLFFYEEAAKGAMRLPFSYPVIGRPHPVSIAVYYVLLTCFCLYNFRLSDSRNKRGDHISILLPVLGIIILCLKIRTATTCTMIDIGQGDSLVIEDRFGANILIDGGSTSVKEAGKYRLIPYLQCHGITRIDYAFLSHGDKDHYSALIEVMETQKENRIKIKNLVLTHFGKTDETYDEVKSAAQKNGINVIYIDSGAKFSLPDAYLKCIYPSKETVAEGNDQSMVLLFTCNDTKMLFTGDLTEEKEGEALEKVEFPIDILKVGHHGSRYSSSEGFINKLSPKTSLISAGVNRYGHPSPYAINRLEDAGSDIYVTLYSGQLKVVFKKDDYEVNEYVK